MNDLENEFISYEQALVLKKLGFDEPCLAKYDRNCVFILDNSSLFCKNNDSLLQKLNQVSAPLYQQTFKWFRDKFGVIGSVNQEIDWDAEPSFLYTGRFWYGIVKVAKRDTTIIQNDIFDGMEFFETYEEAELECIKKLIEIVKRNIVHEN